jgi:hypothetical protein
MCINILGTRGMCECPSYYFKLGFKEGVTEVLTKEERIETVKDCKRILENELEIVDGEMKRLKGE